ncbi:hypothetical protein F2Q65_17655 [Thiohalocapsa marina]|uniref:Uncharacterized protein n=1 Tax=Thiohalocapsa marina TaxID=424902 RepID=A0A5M8FNV6_9GAMM|nr:glycosyltransferase family 39 protein [Thiohalocapsa marina]KAA6182602.1 hypothetical protein F2Q65_17655 [Thiohalocapsa marina]
MPISDLVFAAEQYALLGLALAAAYGWGYLLTPWMHRSLGQSSLLTAPLRMAAGTGLIMIALFIAGTLGHFDVGLIVFLLTTGIFAAVLSLLLRARPLRASLKQTADSLRHISSAAWWWSAIALVLVIPIILWPLQVPLEWDELMYHLPYARFWAQHSAIVLNEWLRYPLFPYNMELLYGAALVFDNDVLPHLFHASTAALTAILTFGIASRFFDRRVGLIAVVFVLHATKGSWNQADVDLGMMLFWTSAFASLALRANLADERFSYLAAFFAAIAVGIKYQALFYLPVFVLLALAVERRPAVIAKAILIFLAAGSYWYLRNWFLSGDPVHPFGGPLFGFWLWTSEDIAGQFYDLERVREPPHWYFWIALAAPLLWRNSSTFFRALSLSAAASVGVWYFASGYPRYLYPAYPMLALLSAYVIIAAATQTGMAERATRALLRSPLKVHRYLPTIVFSMAAIVSYTEASKLSKKIIPHEDDRSALLAERFPGYALVRSLEDRPVEPLYQLGFEDQLYYLGDSIRGDWFGPGRYADVIPLVGDAPALADHLRALGVSSLLVNTGREPFSKLVWDPRLLEHFQLVSESDGALLLRLRDPN